ncbi:MAG: hypothetical protein QG656_1481, partial [Candidatus Hydrogenedentes bacterium]|nr:hypothetical protein [Candidatus Hydrogenedentota bacterium]
MKLSRRRFMRNAVTSAGAVALGLPGIVARAELQAPPVTLNQGDGCIEIRIGSQVVAVYVYEDPALPRPYFKALTTLDGQTVTRPYPPDPVVNKGNDDHATFHPGAWLAFGDIGGNDYWRNKTKVR